MILNCDLVNAVIPLLSFRNCKTNVKVVSLTAPQFEQPWQSGMKLAPGGVMLLRFENGELSNK